MARNSHEANEFRRTMQRWRCRSTMQIAYLSRRPPLGFASLPIYRAKPPQLPHSHAQFLRTNFSRFFLSAGFCLGFPSTGTYSLAPMNEEQEKSKRRGWLPWCVGVLIGIALGWFANDMFGGRYVLHAPTNGGLWLINSRTGTVWNWSELQWKKYPD